MFESVDYQQFNPKPVIGVDEAGRGCLAGPVFAGAVILNFPEKFWDSKSLSPQRREELAQMIKTNHRYGVGTASVEEIDTLNIHRASLLAMKRAVENLYQSGLKIEVGLFCLPPEDRTPAKSLPPRRRGAGIQKKPQNSNRIGINVKEGHLLIDGKFTIPGLTHFSQTPLIKGDQRTDPIMAASIIAKTERDKLLRSFQKDYPKYLFEEHKGYATKKHKAAIQQYGPCPLHRKSFSGVREYITVDPIYTDPA